MICLECGKDRPINLFRVEHKGKCWWCTVGKDCIAQGMSREYLEAFIGPFCNFAQESRSLASKIRGMLGIPE